MGPDGWTGVGPEVLPLFPPPQAERVAQRLSRERKDRFDTKADNITARGHEATRGVSYTSSSRWKTPRTTESIAGARPDAPVSWARATGSPRAGIRRPWSIFP